MFLKRLGWFHLLPFFSLPDAAEADNKLMPTVLISFREYAYFVLK